MLCLKQHRPWPWPASICGRCTSIGVFKTHFNRFLLVNWLGPLLQLQYASTSWTRRCNFTFFDCGNGPLRTAHRVGHKRESCVRALQEVTRPNMCSCFVAVDALKAFEAQNPSRPEKVHIHWCFQDTFQSIFTGELAWSTPSAAVRIYFLDPTMQLHLLRLWQWTTSHSS